MISPTRRLARPLLASVFLSSSIPMLKNQSYLVGPIKEAGLSEPELLAKAHVYANFVGGLALAANRFPRLAALGLAANLAPTTYVGHAFWKAPEDQKVVQKINFFKNASLLGGLLLAAVDTGGRESVPHKIGRVSSRTALKAEKAAAKASKVTSKATGKAGSRVAKRVPVGS